MAANYLSLLMSSVNVTTSDDSDITNTHSTGQVDYLSHEWREEDVWHSWRRMTRQKNEISNGIRLENASWRTWWKQRNGLQTINPETLNWLKDSDVTWLYGPLHTAEDIRPAHSSSGGSAQVTHLSTPPPSPSQRPVDSSNPKPILKHRTVTELLISTLPPPGPTTGLVDVTSLEYELLPANSSKPVGTIHSPSHPEPSPSSTIRPPLLHTRSETNIIGHSPFRKDSPPRIIAADSPTNPRHPESHTDLARHSPSTSSTPHHQQDVSGIRKHIAFNTFVEQCIAIDKPNPYPDSTTSTTSFNSGRESPSPSSPAQRGPYEYVHYSPRPTYQQAWRMAREDDAESNSDDDDDEPIEVKTRSRSSSIVLRARPNLYNCLDRDSRPNSRNGHRERVTIAAIAPTILKTSSHSHNGSPAASSISLTGSRSRSTFCKPHANDLGPSESEDDESEADGDVPLLWVPPAGSGYERDFSVADLDDPSDFSLTTVPVREERERGGRDGRGWVVTPPQEEVFNEQGDSADGRQGRFSRQRQENKRRGRGTRTSKLNGSLSPAEVPSSNTDSSESRSRSRNRTNLLPPRSSSRSRSRSSSAEHRSPNHSSRVLSPDITERQPTERGRPLIRKCDSDSDMRSDKTSRASLVGGIHSNRAQTEAPPPSRISSNEGDTTSSFPAATSMGSSSSSTVCPSLPSTTTPAVSSLSSSNEGPINGSTLSGIRGYIGSIWG